MDAYVSSDQFTEQEARCVVDKISGEVDLAALNANIKSRADQGATSLPGITAQQQSIINQAIQACRGNSHAPTTL